MDIFNEIHWLNFRKLPEIKPLPLNEQTKRYKAYLNELSYQRYLYLNWLEGHKKGPKKLKDKTITGGPFLLQENSDLLLQEDNTPIKL